MGLEGNTGSRGMGMVWGVGWRRGWWWGRMLWMMGDRVMGVGGRMGRSG